MSEEEKESFAALANELDTPCNIVIRRLIRYFLDEKVSWTELFKQYSELPPTDTTDQAPKMRMRSTLDPEQYFTFSRRVEEWGSTPSVVVRRLMLLYVAGKIERKDIW